MVKLLLNANLSPETAQFLRDQFSFDVKCILEEEQLESELVIVDEIGHRFYSEE